MASASAESWKLPSKSVMVPLAVPFTRIFAPIIGSPCESNTTPLTVICWAKPLVAIIQPVNRVKKTLIKTSLFMSPKF